MIEPCTFIIFGATGNLARIKLLPALYHLEEAGRLPGNTTIIGFSRNELDPDAWRTIMDELLEGQARGGVKPDVLERLHQRMHIFSGEMTDPESLKKLKEKINTDSNIPNNMIFYMAIPPSFYGPVSQAMSVAGLNEEDNGWKRIVIEKPFGYDIESAIQLNDSLHQ
ncbi:MAG: glucose-6-phosphate dehydrogenase, partial [Gammaproteobacteria bacterium]|nr:glucose-6-phosphate dehydrogenase [Gammaproteobacteria bacterium]